MTAPAGPPPRPRILVATLSMGALDAVLRAYAAYLPLVYLESETRIELLAASAPLFLDRLSRWTHGRAFGPTLEVRWTRDDLTCSALALFEGDALIPRGDLPTAPITQWEASPLHARIDPAPRERTIILLGVNVAALSPDHALYDPAGGAWMSERAGRLLRYPVRDPLTPRVGLRCLDYTVHGYPALTRLCELVPLPLLP